MENLKFFMIIIYNLDIENIDHNNINKIKKIVLDYSKFYSRTKEKHDEEEFQQ